MMDAIAIYSIMGIYLMGYFSCALEKEENINPTWALPAAILWPTLVVVVLTIRLWKGGANERD